jgi:uroporphyrinogen-III synthase
MNSLNGARVALLESRMRDELADLVRRYGGRPRCAPAVREVALACDESGLDLLRALAAGAFPVAIFQTGVGTTALLGEAERAGLLPALLAALRQGAVVCRGPKPAGVLRHYGVPVTHSAAAPYTTADLVAALAKLELRHTPVFLSHYGERNAALVEALLAHGARTAEICLYEWQIPEDRGPLRDLVAAIIAGEVDAIAVTSQVQARHLFHVADELGQREELALALAGRIAVAVVGPTCAAALRAYGVEPAVVPDSPKMGPMLAALARHLAAAGSPGQKVAHV